MDEANLTRREALARAGKVALGSALLVGPLGGAALAEPAKDNHSCHESTKEIISIAAVAEALAVTFYYNGITRKVGTLITDEQLDYLRAALAQEKHHLELLRGAGAAQPPHTFYFDPATFMQVKHFTDVLNALETAFIGAYAAAIHRLCQLDRADLAELASWILGIEAEHRVLGRDIAGASPPNNLCLEKTPFECVSDAAKALGPFLKGGDGKSAFKQPSDAQVKAKAIPCKD